MYYNENFIKGLSEDPARAVYEICGHAIKILPGLGNGDNCYDAMVETFALLETISQKKILK